MLKEIFNRGRMRGGPGCGVEDPWTGGGEVWGVRFEVIIFRSFEFQMNPCAYQVVERISLPRVRYLLSTGTSVAPLEYKHIQEELEVRI
jgi:hypothetical protein